MSDADLRELERRHGDGSVPLERLQAERLRAGLGWHGERLSPRLTPKAGDPGVYVYEHAFEVRGGPFRERLVNGVLVADVQQRSVLIELVHVLAGEAPCRYGHLNQHASLFAATGVMCSECGGSAVRKIPPFYVGRYPVTCGQWNAKAALGNFTSNIRIPSLGYSPNADEHPVTQVEHEDARSFCSWAGLRLPTEAEWKWAALWRSDDEFDPTPLCPICTMPMMQATNLSQRRAFDLARATGSCPNHGIQTGMVFAQTKIRPNHPWGFEAPSEDRAVWGGMFDRGHENLRTRPLPSTRPVRQRRSLHDCPQHRQLRHWATAGASEVQTEDSACMLPDGTMGQQTRILCPCVDLVPARPLGASWCGALDLWHVLEFVDDGRVIGGSFRSETWRPKAVDDIETNVRIDRPGYDVVGFRVALTAT